jgi:prepilin-type N-terminal cleavage/methylation domain-containing protein
MSADAQKRGFTLIELLVSMAIFVTIMAGVTIMFNAAVRVTKQGYQNQIAYETMRGTIDTIERDLTNSFVARDTGHKHTFYGSPIGFTFIGIISTDGDSHYNLGRITYVIYGGSNPELTKIYEAAEDDETTRLFETDPDFTLDRTTYSLLRFVEPGVEDLESFPINWTSGVQSFETGNTLQVELSNARTLAFENGLCQNNPDDPFVANDLDLLNYPCLEEVTKAKKRELWLRMLAGDPSLPDFWTILEVRAGDIADDPFLDPADYVLAENILHIVRNKSLVLDESNYEEHLKTFNPDNRATYSSVNANLAAPFSPYDSLDSLNPFIDPFGNDLAIIEPLDPQHQNYYQTEAARLQAFISDEYDQDKFTHQNYFFAYREFREQSRLDENGFFVPEIDSEGSPRFYENGDQLWESEIDARRFAYWNDTRNLEHNTILSVANTMNNGPSDIATLEQLSTQPDIIDPALPESILIELAFFYPSPYPGAPDFQKVFTHTINLPTAYKRKQETLWTKQLRNN